MKSFLNNVTAESNGESFPVTLEFEVKWAAVDEVDWSIAPQHVATLERAKELWSTLERAGTTHSEAASQSELQDEMCTLVAGCASAAVNLENLEEEETWAAWFGGSELEGAFGDEGDVAADPVHVFRASFALNSFWSSEEEAKANGRMDLCPSIRASVRVPLPIRKTRAQLAALLADKDLEPIRRIVGFSVGGVALTAYDSMDVVGVLPTGEIVTAETRERP